MKKLILIAALASLTLSMQAMAAGEHRKGLGSEHSKVAKAEKKEKRLLKKLEKTDTSGDGQVDLTEYLAAAEKRFNSTDLNSDGYLTAQEMKTWGQTVRTEIRDARKAARAAEKAAAE